MMMGRESSYMKYHPKSQDIPSNIVMSMFKIIEKVLYSKRSLTGAHNTNK